MNIEGFREEGLEQPGGPEEQMEEIIFAASKVLNAVDEPGNFGEKIKTIVECFDKPDLSKKAREYMDELIGMVKEKLEQPKNYADADIEAAIRSLLSSVYAEN